MSPTVPFLWFDGQAEQAAALYVSLFPDSEVLSTTVFGPGVPGGVEGSVMTVSFRLGTQQWVALNGGPQYRFTEAVSFQVPCADQAEVDHFWDGLLADGGEPGRCGWLKDRFGLSWQVVPTELYALLSDPDAGRAQRATQAMLAMDRLDLAALRAAADAA